MPKHNDIQKVMIIGSGPIVIGQACEFDYSGTQACKALRKLGYEIVLVNSNPATIMTDPEMADATYIEPLTLDCVADIVAKEKPDALLPNLGGQSGLNLSSELWRAGVLQKHGVRVIGVQIDAIERGEDRQAFKDTMQRLGIETPRSEIAHSLAEAEEAVQRIGLPAVIRPAYTMGGTGGGLVFNMDEFRAVAQRGLAASLVGANPRGGIGAGLGRAGVGGRAGCQEPDDHRLLHRERRCDGRPHGRLLLHGPDAHHRQGICRRNSRSTRTTSSRRSR